MKKFGIIIFIATLVLGAFVTSFFSFGQLGDRHFSFSFGSGTKGSGKIVTESRDIKGFTGIDVSGIFQVEIVAQKDFAVEVEADDNLLPLIKTEVRDGILRIETEHKVSSSNPLKVRISAPNVDSLEASGVSKVSLTGVKNNELRVDTSGASKLSVDGETREFTVEVSGASSIDAENLKCDKADIDASGASRVNVFATGDLKADASGASKIIYSGTPKNIEKSSSGASSIREK